MPFFPTSHGSDIDGIVVEAAFTGSGPDRNAVLTHEVGHYFGLYHTFEGGCQNDDCLVDGDKVCDTPPDQSTGYATCSDGMNTCMTDTGFATDQPDMISNYMDYSRLECYNRFTSDQKDRMRFYLESIRSSLLECLGCQDPCNEQITTEILAPGGNLVVCDSLIFTHASVNVGQFEWKVDGSIVEQSGRLALYYDQPGRHEIILIGTSASGNCQDRDTLNIIVGCAFDLQLNNNLPPCIGANTPISLSVTNVPGATISWFIDGNFENNGPTFNKSFLSGAYKVKVLIDDGKCKEEETVTVLVGCEEICGNGFDDDNDGLYDCFDPDCCSECDDFYFQACSEAYEDCLPTQPFSMKQKWTSDQDRHNPVFTLICGDITGDGQVETLSWRYGNEFVFINSNGQTVRRFNVPNGLDVNWVNPAAIADVDGDGRGEIFYISTQDNKIVCLEDDGSLKYETTPVQPGSGFGFLQWDPIHVVDVNLDGRPEVIAAFNIYDAVNGDFLVRSPASVQIPFPAGHYVICDILPDDACIDCEGLEIVSGSQVVTISNDIRNMRVETSISLGTDGNASVVDWDLDGDLDVVGAFGRPRSNIVVWDGQTTIVMLDVNTGSSLGAPVVSNLDADPEPELLMVNVGDWELRRYDNDLSITWRTKINEPTAITPYCFDFHQDGINEIIVRDNSALKIIDGRTGAILDSAVCGSVTNDERPMIADIDGDGHAEIVVSCAGFDNNSIFSELKAFEGDLVEWPKTRPVNFSYSNFLMGINDDLTIPSFSQQHHLPPSVQDLNSSFTQVIIPSEPDTLEYYVDVDSVECAGDQFWITLKICSSGLRSLDSLDISVYNGDPSLGGTARLLTDRLDITMLGNQQCMTIQQWVPRVPGTNYGQFCVIINDDGSRPLPFDYTDGNGFGGPGECDYLNNIACISLPPSNVVAPDILDTVVCNLTNVVIEAPTQLPYRWSDNTMDQDLIVTQSGLYWLEVSDGCGGIDRDSFRVDLFTTPILMLPDTIRFCENGVITLNAGSDFSEYRWQDGRTDSTYTTFGPGKYWVEVTDTCGNVQSDTSVIIITPLPDLALPDTLNICLGDTVSLEVATYDQHLWAPNMEISCENCPRVEVYPSALKYLDILNHGFNFLS